MNESIDETGACDDCKWKQKKGKTLAYIFRPTWDLRKRPGQEYF